MNDLIVTVLRNPVERQLSVLNICANPQQHSLEHRLRAKAAEIDMDSYINNWVHDGLYYSRYALGTALPASMLKTFELVGHTPALGDFYHKLMVLLGVPNPPDLAHDNQSPERFDWTEAQREKVEQQQRSDMDIYKSMGFK
jgi:hypothetical protein